MGSVAATVLLLSVDGDDDVCSALVLLAARAPSLPAFLSPLVLLVRVLLPALLVLQPLGVQGARDALHVLPVRLARVHHADAAPALLRLAERAEHPGVVLLGLALDVPDGLLLALVQLAREGHGDRVPVALERPPASGRGGGAAAGVLRLDSAVAGSSPAAAAAASGSGGGECSRLWTKRQCVDGSECVAME